MAERGSRFARSYPAFSNWVARRMPAAGRITARGHAALIRLSGGRIGKRFLGAPMLVLRTVGRRSGKVRETPVLYFPDGDRYAITASNGASPTTPAWFHNLMAAGRAEVIIAGETIAVEAREADAGERERLWPIMVEGYAGLERYREMTERQMPVVILTRADRPV